MCVVSNIGDYWNKRWPEQYPWIEPQIEPSKYIPTLIPPTREEFEALKKEIEELKELLKAAQKFDEATNQPHCEQEEKIAILKKIAELVGVDLSEVLTSHD